MAERRMFAKSIIDSDAFLDMPLSTQALYFHLAMRADDEGFVGNPKRIRAMIGCTEDDLKILIAKRFILTFDTGVVVIKHWWIHNLFRADRFKDTTYFEEKSSLALDEKKAYVEAEKVEVITEGTPSGNQMATSWQPNGNQMATQDKLSKDKLSKVNISNTVHSDAEMNDVEQQNEQNDDLVFDEKPEKRVLSKQQQDRFDRFWKNYPKKVGKANAEKAWKKIAPDEDETNRILVGLENSKMLDSRFREMQFTPMPSSWLNARGWEDDFEDVPNPSRNGCVPNPKKSKFERDLKKELDNSSFEIDEAFNAAVRKVLDKHGMS